MPALGANMAERWDISIASSRQMIGIIGDLPDDGVLEPFAPRAVGWHSRDFAGAGIPLGAQARYP